MYKPVVLVILDGWGLSENSKGNAIKKANTPTIDKLSKFYPHLALQASGISVGLPWGEQGNSEVGHITLGSGQIVYQSLPRITMSIQSGEFFKNEAFLNAIGQAKKNDKALHLMGLMGKGAVHSHLDHLYALLELCRDQKIEKVFIHVLTDGRDSDPTSGVEVIQELQTRLARYKVGKIASITGRYFAMDRNNNWERTQKAYEMLVNGQGEKISNPVEYLQKCYEEKKFDEYIEPAVIVEKDEPIGKVQDGDSIIFFNFREDRARQITKAFILPGFMKFKRQSLKKINFVAMTEYEEGLPMEVAYPPIKVKSCLGSIISKKSLHQLRISETEKFAHVTYFFNGGMEEPFPREDRVIVPSLSVSTYDKAPEMSAQEITQKVLDALEKDKYSFILINYANADMVGHTGKETATIKAVEVVDKCLEKLIPAVLLKKGCLLITADHGNAEEVTDTHTGEADTEHSVNPVPLWFVTPENHDESRKNPEKVEVAGLLSDIAPTVLDLMEIKKPEEMTGESLLPMLK